MITRTVAGLAVVAMARVVLADSVCLDTDSCLRVVEAKQSTTVVVSARFEQTKFLSLMAEPLVSRGRFAFRKPDQVLWEVEEPKLTLRMDGKGLHLPDVPGANEEIAAVAPFGKMMREMSGLFSGSLRAMQRGFEVQATAVPDGIDARLKPKLEQWRRMFSSITISFRGTDLVMQSLRIEEAQGDRLEIVFSDVHRNDATAAAVLAAQP